MCGWQTPAARADDLPQNGTVLPLTKTPGVAKLQITPAAPIGDARTGHCGAVMIDASWAVTARHCVEDVLWRELRLFFGSQFTSGSRAGGQRLAPLALCPTGTVPGSLEGDVALVKLAAPLPQDVEIAPIFENPDPTSLSAAAPLTAASWPVKNAGPGEPALRRLPISPVSATPRGHVIATLSDRSQRAPCGGESGAPVYADMAGSAQVAAILTAIVTPSWGDGGAVHKCTSPHTRLLISPLAPWRDWVLDTILSCKSRPERCAIPE